MSVLFLVESTDGTLVKKSRDDLKPDDRVVVDGPYAFQGSRAAQRELEAEIDAAGGFDAWRANQDHRA